ncbi:MAG: hypothetical protein AB8B55_10100 [Mariniblastus sp.]
MANQSRRTLLYIFLALLLVTPIAAMILFGMGQTDGSEFSPDDFTRRSFSYNRLPILKWTIIKKTYVDTTTGMEQELVGGNFITPITNPTKTWHLTNDPGNGTGVLPAECDSRFLTHYLDMRDLEYDFFWSGWNTKFPDAATIFWPIVADLARDEMYLKIPYVMEFAMELDELDDKEIKNFDVDEFETDLNLVVAKVYLEMGTLDLNMNRFAKAKSRLMKSDKLSPSQEAKDRLAKCMTQLSGQKEPSAEAPMADQPAAEAPLVEAPDVEESGADQ